MKQVSDMKMSGNRKERHQALWLWWQIFFLAFLMIGTVIFIRPETGGFSEILPTLLKVALVCAIAAVPADLIFYFGGLALFKRRNSYDDISRLISEKGGASREAAELLLSKYENATDSAEAAQWAVYLAAVYSDLGDKESARRYIDAADMSGYFSDPKNEQHRFMIRSYYVTLIGIDMAEKDKSRAERDYTAAFPYFEGIPGGDPHELSVKNLMGEYLIFSGNFPAAVQIADSIPPKDPFYEMTACIIRGTALINMKEFSRAKKDIHRAAEINTNEMIGTKLRNLTEIIEAAGAPEVDANG